MEDELMRVDSGESSASVISANFYDGDIDCVDHYLEEAVSVSHSSSTGHKDTPSSLPSSHISDIVRTVDPIWRNAISACMIDPFGTLPIEVDDVTNQLLHFYGQQSYWQTAYALSPSVKVSMKGSWEYQAGISTTHFHILMARSALHQLRMNRWAAGTTRRHLQYAAAKHQAEAVTILRTNVARGNEANIKEILTSVISLATFEQRYGSREKALMHFKAARDLFKQLGIGEGVDDRLREEQALWFEGIYADPGASFMWSTEDASERLTWLTTLLDEVDRIWKDQQLLPINARSAVVPPETRLREFISRDTAGRIIGAYGDINEAALQMRCLLILVSVITNLHVQFGSKKHAPGAPKLQVVVAAAQGYASWVEDMLIHNKLGEDQALADMLWIMLQNFRDMKPRIPNGLASQALSKLNMQHCHWHACGTANIVKYMPEHRQLVLRDWLLAFVCGRRYTTKIKLNDFIFSYTDFGVTFGASKI
ncbi:hypothetical protein LTR84_010974 [Exophiala bonariae]|uniref:Transcription factor domain-containing protein n=1 Tax=Exophiala bonariae TaxID=1690606 RepID=A0AAV9NJF4_9EURO|nr:hypothetical protein LTR84_010974 [Exophiala bonariae]